jgi:hypothetical protein
MPAAANALVWVSVKPFLGFTASGAWVRERDRRVGCDIPDVLPVLLQELWITAGLLEHVV